MTYQEVLEEYLSDPVRTNDKYDFEHLATYFMQEDDDFEEMINRHAKVALNPHILYVIKKPIRIRSLCYIIGNGATVRISCQESFGIEVYCRGRGPGIVGMWSPTFHNIIFERERGLQGGVINTRTHTIIHGCNFVGIMGTALRFFSGSHIRGCHFYACYKCVENPSKLKLRVSSCTFEKSMMGILSSGPISIKHCSSLNVYSFLYVSGLASVENTTVTNSNGFYESGLIDMVSCHNGAIVPLCTVHICGTMKAPWPSVKNCSFVRCKVFLGCRSGTFSPTNTSFGYSLVWVDKEAFECVNFNHTFHQTTTFWKILRSDADDVRNGLKKCICGALHAWPVLEQLNFTDHMRPDPYDYSCDSRFFSSDDEEC